MVHPPLVIYTVSLALNLNKIHMQGQSLVIRELPFYNKYVHCFVLSCESLLRNAVCVCVPSM